MSDDAKRKISGANRGRVSIRRGKSGKKLSKETKEKLRQMNLGKKLSDEIRRKMSASRTKNK